MIGLLGKKLGMTHVYDTYGRRQMVTAVKVGPCTVVGLCTPEKEGYKALRVGFEPAVEKRLTKAEAGQFKKAGTAAFRIVREFRLDDDQPNGSKQATAAKEAAAAVEYKVGQELTMDLFQPYEIIDVTGISIGKGFQGGMKRWHWSGGNETHGSMSHRRPGSIGSTTTPGRVWKGHHLPGHMGLDQVTVQNLRIIGINKEENLMWIEGVVPGPKEGLVFVKKSRKRTGMLNKPKELEAIIEDDENLSKTAKAASKKPKAVAKGQAAA